MGGGGGNGPSGFGWNTSDLTFSRSAGFFTGGSLAFRGGVKAARNNAIGCAVLLAVIEGVGIAFGKMMAGSTKLEMPQPPPNAEVQAM